MKIREDYKRCSLIVPNLVNSTRDEFKLVNHKKFVFNYGGHELLGARVNKT